MSAVQDTYIVSHPHQRYSKSLGRRIQSSLHLHCISCHVPTPSPRGREGPLNASTARKFHHNLHGPSGIASHLISPFHDPSESNCQAPMSPPSSPASAHTHRLPLLPHKLHPHRTPPRSTPTSHPPNLHPTTRILILHPSIPQHQSTSLSLADLHSHSRTQRTSSIHGQTTSDRGARFRLAMAMDRWRGEVR